MDDLGLTEKVHIFLSPQAYHPVFVISVRTKLILTIKN